MQELIELHVYDKEKWKAEKEKQNEESSKEEISFFKESKKYELVERIKQDLQWKYPNEFDSKVQAKTSVSKLKQMDYEQKEIDFLDLAKDKDKKISSKQVPKFLKEEIEITRARKGTLMHLCIEHINEKEEYTKEKLENLVMMLVQKEFITQKESESISIEDLYTYTKSELFKDIKNAKEINKEKAFYINIDAKEIYNVESKEKILVQGVIDLYYIDKDDHIILVDYKTDFVKTEEELIRKYEKQLEIYKRALEQALEQKVESVYIYSIYLQKRIKVNA